MEHMCVNNSFQANPPDSQVFFSLSLSFARLTVKQSMLPFVPGMKNNKRLLCSVLGFALPLIHWAGPARRLMTFVNIVHVKCGEVSNCFCSWEVSQLPVAHRQPLVKHNLRDLPEIGIVLPMAIFFFRVVQWWLWWQMRKKNWQIWVLLFWSWPSVDFDKNNINFKFYLKIAQTIWTVM